MKKIIYTIVITLALLFIYSCKKDTEIIPTKTSTKGTIQIFATYGEVIPGFSIVKIPTLNNAIGIASDGNNIYISDINRVYKVTLNGSVSTIFGTGATDTANGDGGLAINACGSAYGINADLYGNVFLCGNERVRKINTAGIINTIAGNGHQGFSGDSGLATSAKLRGPIYVVSDTKGKVYFSDDYNARIRIIDTSGIIYTFLGNNGYGYGGDGASISLAKISTPYGICIDKSGNIYFSDVDNYRIRKISTLGIITTIAGTGTEGYSGDGALATSANIGSTRGVCVDKNNNVYFIDYGNKRVRKIDNAGIITTVAGGGLSYMNQSLNYINANGIYSVKPMPALSIELDSPQGICVDNNGDLYVTAEDNVYKIFMN